MKTFCFLWIGFFLLPHLIVCFDGKVKSIDKDSSSALIKNLGDENAIISVVKSLMELASNGFKTGLEASMRSLFNKPMTTAVYAISMLVGVVAMLAFYESPISPMPVPPLPDPPVGRFPPEHPIWPPQQQQQQPNMNDYQNQNQKRSGMIPHMNGVPIQYPVGAAAAFHNYYQQHHNDNHRSDKNTNPVFRNKFVLPSHLNETSYNNYISKLTASFDHNNNKNNNQNNNFDHLKQMYNSNPELNNKVIDYNNKRIAVESIKHNGSNQTMS